MLVLTRRSKEKLSFPQVGITIHFVRVQSGQVKIGVDAPRDIAIIRGELDNDEDATASLVRRQLLRLPREVRHGIRNQLHEISVGMHLYRELISAGLAEEAESTFESLVSTLQKLDENEVLKRPTDEPTAAPAGTIVLAEDVPNEREMLASFLRLRGYHCVSFGDGHEVLQYLSENEAVPRVVIVDMNMPRCDGPTTVREIRSNERFGNTQLFAVSGMSPAEYGLGTGRGGVDRWFPKPLNPALLLDALDMAVERSEWMPT
ncbi:MAG: carbon storage regulator [Planctomycetales bacterium]|nr:carbon storage regulator [Planctomycetales bacterium]